MRCLDNAFGLITIDGNGVQSGTSLTDNGRILRNLIHGADLVMSHILHFYHLSAPDFIDPSSVPDINMSPWTPNFTDAITNATTSIAATLVGHYVTALEMRRKCHAMGAIFSGKQPCQAAMCAGGVTGEVTTDKKDDFKTLCWEVRNFINDTYIQDVLTVANLTSSVTGYATPLGCMKFLSYGCFDMGTNSTTASGLKNSAADFLIPPGVVSVAANGDVSTQAFDVDNITEYIDYSYYTGYSGGKKPLDGATIPDAGKSGAYSWVKAPRYNGCVCEVGPLARILAATQMGSNKLAGTAAGTTFTTVSGMFGSNVAKLCGILGRHATRAIEALFVADAMYYWVDALEVGTKGYKEHTIPRSGTGIGLTEAPRGALGHWIKINNRKIEKYMCVVPSTWNGSPRTETAKSNWGAAEQAVYDMITQTSDWTTNSAGILDVLRVIHTFDFCAACAIHLVQPDGSETVIKAQ